MPLYAIRVNVEGVEGDGVPLHVYATRVRRGGGDGVPLRNRLQDVKVCCKLPNFKLGLCRGRKRVLAHLELELTFPW